MRLENANRGKTGLSEDPPFLEVRSGGGAKEFFSNLLAVIYYLIETRRLRLLSQQQVEVSERARWPLIAFTLELEAVLPEWKGAALYARNLGDGPAVNVTISGLATSFNMRAVYTAVSALSASGQTVVAQWQQGMNQESIRQEVGNMTLCVRCSEQPGKRRLSWVWVGQPDSPGQFTLQSFDEGS